MRPRDTTPPEWDRADERRQMVREIAAETAATARWIGKTELAARVMAAMARVPRHEFVPKASQALAYANSPLPIGRGQTISQPYIVALMTDLARVDEESVALEIGTGCGYQAAVLAEVAKSVYSIEIVPELASEAVQRLARLCYDNVAVRSGDGYRGWEEHAPFDAILVTAAAPEVPPPLIAQLAPGGRLVIPLGATPFAQELTLVEKNPAGEIETRDLLPVAFVPFTR